MTDTLTPEQIAALRTINDAAAKPLWRVKWLLKLNTTGQYWTGVVESDSSDGVARLVQAASNGGAPELELIAAMRNALPALLDAYEERDRLRAELAQAREQELEAIVAYIWQEADKRSYSARTWLRFLANNIKRGKYDKEAG